MHDASLDLRVETTPNTVRVFSGASDVPILVQNSPTDQRPFIHPIAVPGTSGSITENAPPHHPWQHGLYIGLNDVNGAGFWSEGLDPGRAEHDGTFHPQIDGLPTASGNSATWRVATEYRDQQRATLLHETQAWTMTNHGDNYALDLIWSMTADVPLTFGEYEYGGLFLRMPYRPETGGTVFNSAGQTGDSTEGQRAEWTAVQMPIEGSDEDPLVVLMDHPTNLEHPVPWRVDGQLGVSPSVCISGPWHLGKDKTQTFRHRLVVFPRAVEKSRITAAWAAFSRGDTA